jgi:hypothetical protein
MPIARISNALRRFFANPTLQGLAVNQAPAGAIGDAPVTISLSQLNGLYEQIQHAHERARQLENELVQTRMADPTKRTHALNLLARNMLHIVRFAIANLPPSEIPKWPHEAVAAVAGGLKHLVDFNEDDQVLAAELALFVKDIHEGEVTRAEKRLRARDR